MSLQSLTASSTPQQIAAAYKDYSTVAGNNVAVQDAARTMLLNKGIAAPTINQAFGLFSNPVALQPVAAPVAAPVVAPATQKVAAPATKTTSAPVALSQPATVAPKAPVVAAPASTASATGGVSDAFILSWLAKNPNPSASQISALSQFGVTPDRVKALSGAAPAPVAVPVAPTVAAPAAVTPTAENPFPGMTVEDLYRMHAGKEPDAEGLAFWKSAFGPEISEAERAQFIKSVLEVQNKPAVQPAPAATSTATPAKPAAEQNKPTTLETLYKDVLGRTPSQAEIDSWGFGSEISPEERDQFLYTAQSEAINNMPKTGAVGNLAQQIMGQNLTDKWSGEGWGSAERNAYDMAAILASAGITDISQFGRVEYPDVAHTAVQKEFINMDYGDSSQAVETGKYFMTDAEGNKTYVDPSQVVPGVVDESGGVGYFLETPSVSSGYGNKVTGELIPTTHSGPGENSWGGTSAGKGDTSYGVQFDDQGKPVFYTQYVPKQNAFAGFMSDLGPVGQIGLAVATGGLSIPQQIAAQAAIGLASGKDFKDIAKGALTSYALGGLSDVAAIKEGAQYLNSVDPSGALAGAFQGAVSSGVQAGVSGGSIGDAVLAGAVSGGVSGAVNSLMDAPEFKDLTAAQKRIASNAAAGVLTGKPLDQVVVDAAVAAARDAAKSSTGQQARAPAPVEDMGPTSYGTNVTQQLTDAGLIDEGGQFADAGSLTDADLAEIVGGTPQYASQVQNIISDALGSVGIAQALPNPSMPGYGAALEKAGPALYKVVADAANDPDYLRKLPLLEKALSAAGTSVAKILGGAPLELATYAPELGSNEAELLARARKAGITLDANPAGAGRGFVNPTAPSTSPSPAPKPAPTPKPDYVVQPGDYTDTTEEIQPWQLVDPISGLPLPAPDPEVEPDPTPEEPFIPPEQEPANDPFDVPAPTPQEPLPLPEQEPANEPEFDPRKPVFVPYEPSTYPKPEEDPWFDPRVPETWPDINIPPLPAPTPLPSPSPAPSPVPKPTPSPAPSPLPRPAPTPSPDQAPKPQPAPAPSPSPSPQPLPTPSPSPSPAPAPAPKPSPETRPQPAPQPRPKPEPAPKPSPKPQPKPAPQPKPQPQPAPAPAPQPEPIPKPQPSVVKPPVVKPPEVKPPVVNPPVVVPPAKPPEPQPPVVNPPVVIPPVKPPEVNPPEVKPPVVKTPAVKVPPKVVQQVALQLGVPATSQIAQDIAEALYGTMDYLDISEEFRPSERKARPAATQKQMQQTKMAQGGYLDTMLAENMSVDDLLNLLR